MIAIGIIFIALAIGMYFDGREKMKKIHRWEEAQKKGIRYDLLASCSYGDL
jgi:hypothetical protein